jgi:peptidylprolyl isomerase
MKRTLIVAAAAASLTLSLAACGSQTDERVATPDATAAASAPAASAPASSAAANPNASAIASAIAATPFVTVDCVSGQAMPTDTAPNGTTIGSVTASLQATGVPAITVATDAQPATELGIADVQEGSGAAVKAGDTLTVNYCGVGLGSKTLFDSSWARGTPASFGLDQVIPGWQQGMPGMKVGGTRLLVIPGALAYGQSPPQGILPDETLVFVVELQSIN